MRTVMDEVEAYISSRDDLRETTRDGYRIVAETAIYGRFGEMPASEMASCIDKLGARRDDPMCDKAFRLLRNVSEAME